MANKIPTAREMMQSKNGDDYTHWEEIHDMMIEFAKLHVKAALEAVTEKVEMNVSKQNMNVPKDAAIYTEKEISYSEFDSNGPDYHFEVTISKESILTAYPEENIK